MQHTQLNQQSRKHVQNSENVTYIKKIENAKKTLKSRHSSREWQVYLYNIEKQPCLC